MIISIYLLYIINTIIAIAKQKIVKIAQKICLLFIVKALNLFFRKKALIL